MNKKVLITAAALTFVFVGCSNQATNQKAEEKIPSASAILKKTTANQKKQDNVHLAVDTVAGIADEKMKMLVDADFSFKPVAMDGKYSMAIDDDSREFRIYAAKDKFYLKDDEHEWQDMSDQSDSLGIDLDSLISHANGADTADLSADAKKAAKVTEINGNYTIKMKLTGKAADKLIKKGNESLDMSKSVAAKTKVKSVNYHYVIDKKTSLPEQLKVKIKLDLGGAAMTETIDSKYSRWNESAVTEPKL
ncbi:hypothetical protein FC62_GL000711 [Amylolactobacillus amylotrophicus DSM 20534]|uniref:Uncharacterized protein n=3 Tax=Amylolactobacillus TaxID=2767876 RepID=A0A1L6XB35_9LACO|nr:MULTISPECIES: DUF6612 family protein [Amylolactobacillus]APT18172.1 hypothetical protein LA20533_02280 [Amylolactobacillus amylophilus DSM 20533 = JCM 1125]KRK37944.1 hypothetical protein FC62_GL000711 [Amylolactobacillus amylotrophicus DSM 20534]KRM42204.1 hypothetical protein FD40_GL000990 [Amylolactobacillus amylophilus DSM 20533 = JCM 1125]GED80241.1 hypothetical protein LAM01_07140 [Amylolactobacillus amylophilus]